MPEPVRKRIIRQQPQQQQAPSGKVIPKKREIVTEDDEEVEFEEIEEVVKPSIKKRSMAHPVEDPEEEPEEVDEGEEEQEEEPPRRKAAAKSGAKDELAVAFAQVPLSQGDVSVKAGNHEAVITMTLQPKKEGSKARAVRINAKLCEKEYEEVQPLATWRYLMTKAGDANPTAYRILAREMAMLGYKMPDPEGGENPNFTADLEEVLGDLSQNEPGAIIKVFYEEYQGIDQVRFNVQAPCDNEIIQEYKDTLPY